MPFIVAIHDVSDADRLWGAASEATPQLPPDVTLHMTYPQHDGTRAVCLWEAPSVEGLRELLDGAVGDSARNEFFEVDPQHPGTRGLPAQAATGG